MTNAGCIVLCNTDAQIAKTTRRYITDIVPIVNQFYCLVNKKQKTDRKDEDALLLFRMKVN